MSGGDTPRPDATVEPARSGGVGRVALVGAGPGSVDLWTLRGARLVREADVVLHDALVDLGALRGMTDARLVSVGKRGGRPSASQAAIHRLLVREATRGHRVVRLKGGDPFVFGRGGEEVLALAEAGVAVEVVPGVTTAVAAPAAVGIPLTHRGLASGFVVVTGHDSATIEEVLAGLRPGPLTLVVLMGLRVRAEVAAMLTARGWPGDTPAAVVCDAFMPTQWAWVGQLAHVAAAPTPEGASGVLVVGEVTTLPARVAAMFAGRRVDETA